MSKYSKINFIYFLQKWMDSVPGQTFLNYAYSWGAAVVILGTLFKLTHLPGANFMLFLGMGTEVVVFFISAFDRPFDKTTIDMELDNHMADQVIDSVAASPLGEAVVQPVAVQPSSVRHGVTQAPAAQASAAQPVAVQPVASGGVVGNTGGVVGGTSGVVGTGASSGTVIIGGTGSTGAGSADTDTAGGNNGGSISFGSGMPSGGTIIIGGGSQGRPAQGNGGQTTPQEKVAEEYMASVAEASSESQPRVTSQPSAASIITPAPAVSQETAAEMEVVTKAYIERLAELNEMLEKVGQLTSRLSTDSEEMENLNRTLTGIARVYEMQLKSASQQITTQDSINEQTRIMAKKIQELNGIYTRMIEAMTVNMPGGIQNNA